MAYELSATSYSTDSLFSYRNFIMNNKKCWFITGVDNINYLTDSMNFSSSLSMPITSVAAEDTYIRITYTNPVPATGWYSGFHTVTISGTDSYDGTYSGELGEILGASETTIDINIPFVANETGTITWNHSYVCIPTKEALRLFLLNDSGTGIFRYKDESDVTYDFNVIQENDDGTWYVKQGYNGMAPEVVTFTSYPFVTDIKVMGSPQPSYKFISTHNGKIASFYNYLDAIVLSVETSFIKTYKSIGCYDSIVSDSGVEGGWALYGDGHSGGYLFEMWDSSEAFTYIGVYGYYENETFAEIDFDGVNAKTYGLLCKGDVRNSFDMGMTPNATVETRSFGAKCKTITNANTPFSVTDYTTPASYRASDTFTLLCDCTDGAITVNLPAVSTYPNRIYVIKKIDASGNAVTIDGNASETIDGETTKALAAQWNYIMIHNNGTAWYKIAGG